MEIFKTKKHLQNRLNTYRETVDIVGLIPTMGALHQGHLSLIKSASEECDFVVVSIFINPTQFDNKDDLTKYPKNLTQDLELLDKSFDNLIIFSPDVHEIYGEYIASEHFDFGEIENQMEGQQRAGHFDGVGTILKKLFNIVKPDKAFFGEKDYQQLLIVKKLVSLLNLPIQIIGCPISRETNGLARSSRNERLSPKEREKAAFIYQGLLRLKADFGTNNVLTTLAKIKEDYKTSSDFKLDYLIIADAQTLKPSKEFDLHKKYRAFVAVKIGGVRLIDNMALN